MNILLASSRIIPSGGGIASYTQELLDALHSSYNIYVLTDADETINDNRIRGYFTTYGHNIGSYDYATQLLGLIVKLDIKLVINSNSEIISILSPFIKVPIISVSHFTDGDLAVRAGFNSDYVNHIIALSYYAKDYLESTFKITDSNKVQVIYNFVNSSKCFNSAKISRQTLNLVYPGGCSTDKCPDIVLLALSKLLKTDLNFKFYWLGNTTTPLAKFNPLKRLSSVLPNDSRVIFTGYIPREKAIEIIQNCNIFVLPSRREGCAMTLLEAMQCGCIPVVSDDKHASVEILNDGKFGIVIKDITGKKLAKAITDIINNHSDYISSYNDSYSYANTKLSKDVWTSKMEALIADSVRQHKLFIEFSESNFRNSVDGLKKMLLRERNKQLFRRLGYYISLNLYNILIKFKFLYKG